MFGDAHTAARRALARQPRPPGDASLRMVGGDGDIGYHHNLFGGPMTGLPLAERVRAFQEMLPDARSILMVREPASRVLSEWHNSCDPFCAKPASKHPWPQSAGMAQLCQCSGGSAPERFAGIIVPAVATFRACVEIRGLDECVLEGVGGDRVSAEICERLCGVLPPCRAGSPDGNGEGISSVATEGGQSIGRDVGYLDLLASQQAGADQAVQASLPSGTVNNYNRSTGSDRVCYDDSGEGVPSISGEFMCKRATHRLAGMHPPPRPSGPRATSAGSPFSSPKGQLLCPKAPSSAMWLLQRSFYHVYYSAWLEGGGRVLLVHKEELADSGPEATQRVLRQVFRHIRVSEDDPGAWRRVMRRVVAPSGTRFSHDMLPETRALLRELYREPNERLAELLQLHQPDTKFSYVGFNPKV
eukprot:jgi/Mesvir1/8871/Mv02765-RA.1